jgi:hypothetical protein
MNTIREEIILELLARAAVIVTTGAPQAYATDIGATVFRARPKVDPDDPPCCVIWPQIEEAENTHGKTKHKMPVQVDGLAIFGATDPSVIGERILGDLIKCFTSPAWSRTRTGTPAPQDYIESIVYQGGGPATPEDGAVSVGASAKFLVTYWTKTGDPYSQ